MKSLIVCSTLLAAVSLLAADKDDVTSAAQKLADADNYSWTSTMAGGNNAAGASTHGKIQKDGLTWIQMIRGENTTEAFVKGGKGAVKTEDGWDAVDLTAAPAPGGGGGGGGGGNAARMGRGLRNFKAPAVQAADIVGKTKDITKTADVYAGDLTEEGAKSLATMGGRRGGAGGGAAPTISNVKGSAKFWIKDGVITKYVLKVSGTRTRDGEDTDFERTTTVEIKDVGTTKLTVPDEAKNKMS